MDWNNVLGRVIEISIPIIAAFLIPIAKKAARAFERRVKLDTDAEEQKAIDKAIEEAVRATEENFKGKTRAPVLPSIQVPIGGTRSDDKENMAVKIASKSILLDESTLRDKIKAKVNLMYNDK